MPEVAEKSMAPLTVLKIFAAPRPFALYSVPLTSTAEMLPR